MHRFLLSMFACVASCTLAIAGAPAAVRAGIAPATVVVSSKASDLQSPTSNSTSTSRHARALTHAARKARKARKEKTIASVRRPPKEHVVVHEISNKGFAAAQKAEQAESNARAERLYRASQFSAPLLIDAKACKRVGANGESIYENC